MAQYTLAVKTMTAIETAIEADQGAKFRYFQGLVMPHMKDAFRPEEDGFRSHLGASVIGKNCARSIWYDWRWARKPRFSARMIRLFNRGHLEEARFIASLLTIGCQVYQQDANGNQYRISHVGGHFGGSGDGIVVGLPDLPPGTAALSEFKTHGEKSFIKLQKEGVYGAKFEHYVQMNIYMRKMGLMYALYGAVNKNTDEYHMEIVTLDPLIADQFLDRGTQIIWLQRPPDRINNASPGLFECRYCDNKGICFDNAPMVHNCRTCRFSTPLEDGRWMCRNPLYAIGRPDTFLDKEQQLVGCDLHIPL